MTSRPDLPARFRDQFQCFQCGDWQVWIDSRYSYPDFENELSRPRDLFYGDRVLAWYKKDRNRLAEIAWPTEDAGSVILKSYEPGSFFNKLRLLMGEPRALRHWNNSWLLQQKQIRTPQAVFIALNDASKTDQGVLAVETIENCRTIREVLHRDTIAGGSVQAGSVSLSLSEFVAICGRYVREIHDNNIVHRDFSGANILIPDNWCPENTPVTRHFVMLDINRVQDIAPGEMNINLRIQDLERLGIPESVLEDYYFAYAGDDLELQNEWPKFLKYRKGYRRIRETKNPLVRGFLKIFTYWPRTG